VSRRALAILIAVVFGVTLAGYALYSLTREPTSQSLAYALRKGLAREAAEKFKDVNYDENSKGLIDLVAQLPWNKQISSDVLNILDEITKDNEVTALEKNLFDDKFVNQTKPQVEVSWKPEKVVWDKIYDIKVHIIAQDDKTPIANVTLKFIPVEYDYFITEYGMRPEDYPRAFPNINDNRTFVLKPVDGRFDELREEFVVDITNITGGGEYRIVVMARDAAGNEGISEIKTPYIRQFENFGKQLYEKGIIISAVYEPWDMKKVVGKYNLPDKPLLGLYDASDEIVQWKHIDWANGYGINVFYVDGGCWEDWKINGYEGRIIKGLMDKGMKCAIQWGWDWYSYKFEKTTDPNLPPYAVDLSNPKNSAMFKEIINPILNVKMIFTHHNYYKVNGKPTIFLYNESPLYNEGHTFKEIIQIFNTQYGTKPYLIADTLFRITSDPNNEHEKYFFSHKDLEAFDALTSWIGFGFAYQTPERAEYTLHYDKYLYDHIAKWYDFTKNHEKDFVNTVIPGFRPASPPNEISIERSPNLFEKRLNISYSFFEREIRIDTWNDFGENTFIEPSEKESFSYLIGLKTMLEDYLSSSRKS